MKVYLYDDSNALVWSGDLSKFIVDNELDPDDAELIEHDLYHFGTVNGGGGAAPDWHLVAAEVQPGEIA